MQISFLKPRVGLLNTKIIKIVLLFQAAKELKFCYQMLPVLINKICVGLMKNRIVSLFTYCL